MKKDIPERRVLFRKCNLTPFELGSGHDGTGYFYDIDQQGMRDRDLGETARELPVGYVLYHGVLGWRCCPRAKLSHDEQTQWARPEDAITEMLRARQGEK